MCATQVCHGVDIKEEIAPRDQGYRDGFDDSVTWRSHVHHRAGSPGIWVDLIEMW